MIELIEYWIKASDQILVTRAVLMYPSNAFDCISHDLLIAKVQVHGVKLDTVTFLKKTVQIRNGLKFFFLAFHKDQY